MGAGLFQIVSRWLARGGGSDRPGVRPVVVTLVIVIVLAALLVGRSPDYFGRQELVEAGDEAANALQIEHAKAGREIYGNYSRWGFHHPGPAWWYAYAAGEIVLRDWTGWVASPANAHHVTGLMLQLLCWAGAIAGVVQLTGRRELAWWGALGAVVHATLINADVAAAVGLSLWPPHVLLGPFMLLIVLAAGTGSGWRWALPGLVAVGVLLVHGHVAQPLFVGVTAIGAVIGWIRSAASGPGRRWWAPALVAGALLLVGLLPLGLDLLAPAPRNVDLIASYLEEEHPPKSWAQAVAYTGSFFNYTQRQEWWFSEEGEIYPTLWREAGPGLIVGWIAVGTLLVLLVKRIGAARRSEVTLTEAARGWRWLAGLVLLNWGLAVGWAKMQSGPLAQFNSFFVYGLVGLTYLTLLAAGLPRWRWLGDRRGAWFAAAAIVLVLGLRPEWRAGTDPAEQGFNARVAAVLDPGVRHHLEFDHDDWPRVVQVALALERLGGTFEVAENWEVLFGRRFAVDLRSAGETDWIRLSAAATDGARLLPNGLWVTAAEPPALAAVEFALTFGASGNARPYLWTGFSHDEPDRVWSDGPAAALRFSADPLPHDAVLVWAMEPFVPSTQPRQRVEVWLDGVCLATLSVTAAGEARIPVPAAAWNRRRGGGHVLVFEFPDAKSPRETGVNPDRRRLAFSFTQLRLE